MEIASQDTCAPAWPQWLRATVALLAALAAALLCFIYVEKPGRELLRPKSSPVHQFTG